MTEQGSVRPADQKFIPALNTLRRIAATGSVLALALCLGATIPLAALSYYLVERPVMGWGKR